jgi:hypothetical protein
MAQSVKPPNATVSNPIEEPSNDNASPAYADQAGWLLNTDEAATFLGLSPHTLSKWRITGNGPPFRLLGRRCLYSPEDLRRWSASKVRKSTSDFGVEASS